MNPSYLTYDADDLWLEYEDAASARRNFEAVRADLLDKPNDGMRSAEADALGLYMAIPLATIDPATLDVVEHPAPADAALLASANRALMDQLAEARALCRALLARANNWEPIPSDLPDWLTERNAVLDWPISRMGEGHGGVWTRARNCLENLGCDTVADVCRHTETQLLKQRNMGRLALATIRGWLADHGLALREVPHD